MSKSLSGKVTVILGASGIVGYGATHFHLTEGATVVAVGREKKKLEEFKKKLGSIAEKNLILVAFDDYNEEKSVGALKSAVYGALPKDTKIDHVISNLGWLPESESPTKSGVKALKATFDEALYTNVTATSAFLPDLKDREGSTFSLVSGGLAHFHSPQLLTKWTATVKNAAMNAFYLTLVAEAAGTKVRVGNFCIHLGVAYPGGDKNQWGFPAINTMDIGGTFTLFASDTSIKGSQWCLSFGEGQQYPPEKERAGIMIGIVKGGAKK